MIVLWSVGMLALLGTQLTAAARVQMRLAVDARDRAEAEAAADGSIRVAAFMLLGGSPIGASGRPVHLRLGNAEVDILAGDEAAKINPNTVSRQVLRGVLVAVGVDQPRADRLSGEIYDWRNWGRISVLGGPKLDQYRGHGLPYRSGDSPFISVDEIGLVPDMTQDIMARLRPWLSVYHEGDVSDPGGVSPAGAAVADARYSSSGVSGPGYTSRNTIIGLRATAVVYGRARFVRSAVVRMRAGPGTDLRMRAGPGTDAGPRGDLLQILNWE